MSSTRAQLMRAQFAREIGSLSKFIVEWLEPCAGNSITLGTIYLRYLHWRPVEEEQMGTHVFLQRFKRLVVRLVPNCEIHIAADRQAIVVWNVRLKQKRRKKTTP